MKTRFFSILALASLLTATSCMDGDWDAPSPEVGMAAYGNQYLDTTNLITVAQLKQQFSSEISNSSLKQVTKATQIQGVVIGNDEGGNIYNSIYIKDATGAIAVSISQAGLFGPFSVGQSVLIELKDLYVGGYGKQPQIGTTYTSPTTGRTSVGRMSRVVWQLHYKLINPISGLDVKPVVVKNMSQLNIDNDCGQLVTLRGVELAEANDTAVFAPSDGSVALTSNCANRSVKGMTDVVVRTSTYADFANKPMPTGRVDITGIASRYNNTWQILMRSENDIQPAKDGDDDGDTPAGFVASGTGTQADPFNVQAIIDYVSALSADTDTNQDYYVKGIVTEIPNNGISTDYNNVTFYISDSADGGNKFYVYRANGLNGGAVTADVVKVGDEVVIFGSTWVNYKGNTPETKQGKAYIYSVNGKTE